MSTVWPGSIKFASMTPYAVQNSCYQFLYWLLLHFEFWEESVRIDVYRSWNQSWLIQIIICLCPLNNIYSRSSFTQITLLLQMSKGGSSHLTLHFSKKIFMHSHAEFTGTSISIVTLWKGSVVMLVTYAKYLILLTNKCFYLTFLASLVYLHTHAHTSRKVIHFFNDIFFWIVIF